MSLYPTDGGLGHNMAGPSGMSMSMLDQSGMLDGLDMDMSLPMDLDIDLSSAAAAVDPSSFDPMGMQQTRSSNDIMGSHSQDHTLGTPSGANGFGAPNSTQQQQQIDNPTTGAGAGPLPTGFGLAPPANSSTLTDFTKRRNWSQRIIEELKDFLHILTPDGRILYVSPSCRTITGYEPQQLVGKFIGEYVHPADSGIFMREFNESIASGNPLRLFFRFKKEDGTYVIFECDGHPHISPEPSSSQVAYANGQSANIAISGTCRGFFMMARPYPTRNAAMLDSFLEHKIENERLMKRIEELKREEVEENAEQDRVYRGQVSSQSGTAPVDSQAGVSRAGGDGSSEAPAATPNYQCMPPPAKPSISNTALTRQNLDSALSAQRPDSMADKMSRYEANGNTHLESIELLTGLRYRDGERSHGISTGDTSPALIRGDAGIAILLDRDREGSRKEKKKIKVTDEYVCADCGTLDSPEWRKGPKGPKTLCNACGLRWAKKEKKKGGDDGAKTNSPVAGGTPGQQSAQMALPPTYGQSGQASGTLQPSSGGSS